MKSEFEKEIAQIEKSMKLPRNFNEDSCQFCGKKEKGMFYRKEVEKWYCLACVEKADAMFDAYMKDGELEVEE